jgi:hypothetical protein
MWITPTHAVGVWGVSLDLPDTTMAQPTQCTHITNREERSCVTPYVSIGNQETTFMCNSFRSQYT